MNLDWIYLDWVRDQRGDLVKILVMYLICLFTLNISDVSDLPVHIKY